MNISISIVAYNEEAVLDSLFQDILSQDYPHEKIELLLIDSASTDKTKLKMELFASEKQSEFYNIKILDNPKKRLAQGWNIAIANFTTEVLMRIDAHASIPSDFIQKNIGILKSGEMVSGGSRPNINSKDTKWNRVLLEAESSMFGSSIAPYRRNGARSYVKSIFHGAYRREVLERVGGFDESLGRTEDNEFHYRVRKAGYRLCFDPDIVSYQHVRTSLKGMCKQKAGNGFWAGTTLAVCPGCLSLFHFVPVCFLFGIILTSILAIVGFPLLAYIMWASYWILAVFMAIKAVQGEPKYLVQLCLPVLFFLLHVSYGAGTLVGIIYMPFFRYKHRAFERQNRIAGGRDDE